MTTIGIIREGKNPPDSRAPMPPGECKVAKEQHASLRIKVQSSPSRCFSDDEYRNQGIEVVDEVSQSQILLGVKEVPLEMLVAGKTYLFFSHTIKKQPQNKRLLQEIINQKIRLIDYECLTDEKGVRVIAFGRWAGIVGAHNGLFAWGKKTGRLALRRVTEYKDYAELKKDYERTEIPPLRIAVTGDGRVAGGAVEVMEALKIKRLSPDEFLKNEPDESPVYVQLATKDLYAHPSGKPFELQEFFEKPDEFVSDFGKWQDKTDLLINAIFWHPKAPRHFTLDEMRLPAFKIKTIADISCDINGSVPATLRATTIADPVYGFNPHSQSETAPFLPDTVDIMAIDNLPNELPRDASESFGQTMVNMVIPELLKPQSDMIERATIAKDGALTHRFQYLSDYISGGNL